MVELVVQRIRERGVSIEALVLELRTRLPEKMPLSLAPEPVDILF